MMKKRQTLEGWIREALTDDQKDGKCTMISLVHHNASGTDREVHSIKLGKPWEPKELAQIFQHKADGYAQDLDGTQQFLLLAFYNDNSEPSASHPFKVGGTLFASDELASDEPNAKGVLAQALRHSEAVMQMAWKQSAILTELQTSVISRMAQQNEALNNTVYQQADMLTKLLVERDQKTHEHRLELMSREERGKLLAFAPALINSMTGRQVFPESTADTALLEMAAEKLTEEQIQQLSAVLPGELWGPIAGRLMQIMQKKRQAKAELTRPLLSDINPEDDAAGDVHGGSNGQQ